jgi:DNA-binding NarL/FixJ family response regulator
VSIRIVIADDHPVVRKGLVEFLSDEEEMDVVAQCSDGASALAATRRLKPDVLILDLRMPDMNGLDVVRQLTQESGNVPVLMLVGNISDAEVVEAMRIGVKGIVLKEMAPNLLVASVRKVAAGGVWLEKDAVARAFEKMLDQQEKREKVASALTRREIEIVTMVAKGLGNRDIGEALFISEATVKTHLHSIYEKTEVKGRMQLAAYAREHGLA